MSGRNDVLLRDLKVEQVKCRTSGIGEVTMADFLDDKESNDNTLPVLTGNTGGSSGTSAARKNVNKARNSKKWIHSKRKKPRKKKRDGPIEMMSKSEEWEKVRKEETEERIKMQSAQYYELNKPTRY